MKLVRLSINGKANYGLVNELNKLIVFTLFTIFSCKSGCTYTDVHFVSVAIEAFGVVDARFDDRAKILMRKSKHICNTTLLSSQARSQYQI